MEIVEATFATRDLIDRVQKLMDDPRVEHLKPMLASLVLVLTARVLLDVSQEHRIRELTARVTELERRGAS